MFQGLYMARRKRWNTKHLYEMNRHGLRCAAAAADGCNRDNLCDIFNGMLENAISSLFPRKLHYSNSIENIKNNFPSSPWHDKECKSL